MNKLTNFREFVRLTEYELQYFLKESVINKVKKLYFIKDPDKLVSAFKEIFDIKDNIKIEKVDIGGSINVDSKVIKFSTNNSLIHELIHYIQLRKGYYGEYHPPKMDNEGLLRYVLQPLELNNWALSLADEALAFKSFSEFLNIGEETKNFKEADRKSRLKHIIFLLKSNIEYDNRSNKYKQKLLKLTEQYYITIKMLSKDINEFNINEIVDIL